MISATARLSDDCCFRCFSAIARSVMISAAAAARYGVPFYSFSAIARSVMISAGFERLATLLKMVSVL